MGSKQEFYASIAFLSSALVPGIIAEFGLNLNCVPDQHCQEVDKAFMLMEKPDRGSLSLSRRLYISKYFTLDVRFFDPFTRVFHSRASRLKEVSQVLQLGVSLSNDPPASPSRTSFLPK